jgi:Spy/CpxP family protein refolding chaperone
MNYEGVKVMRFLNVVLFLVVALAVCAKLSANGQRQENGSGRGEGLAERIQDLNLTDQQETKIEDIQKECRPKVEEAAKEVAGLVKEEVDKIREVLTPEQKTKLESLREERKEQRVEGLAGRIAHLKDLDLTDSEKAQIAEVRNEFRPKIVKAMEGFRGILNADQTKGREEALNAGKKRREILESLNLTAEQKEKAESACKEVTGFVKEEMEKIRDVLTAEQREKLGELKEERKDRVRNRWASRIANFQDLNLTDEQKTKIEAIRKEFRPKVHEAGNKLRGAVREEIDMIVSVLKG